MTADKPLHVAPKLRFPEFRDDPPWLAPAFADLYSFKRTNTLSRDKLNYGTGAIRNIHYGDIHTKFKPLFRMGNEYVPYINLDASANGFDDDAFCEEGDIVLADASEDLDAVGKAIEVVSLDGERVVAGMHTILATRLGSVPVVGFGAQLFQSAAVRTGIKKEAQGAKVYGISAKRVSAVPVPIPPTEVEQQKIADCLGSLDDLIEAEGWKLEALRQHKQGLMQQLFPLPIETLPRLRFPEFRDAAEWSLPTLQQLLKIRATYGIVKAGEYLASGVPMVRGGDIKDGKVSVALPLVAPEIHEQFERTRLLRNDVVIALVGYPGEAAVIPDALVGANVSRAVGVLRVAPSLNPHYLAAYLNSPSGRKSFLKSSSGSAQIVVNLSDLNVLQLPLPEIYEQERIACFVAALNAHLGAQILKLNALRRHKQGLLQQLFPSPKMK